MPTTDGKYSDFDNVGSGLSGTVEGLIDMEGTGGAFRYQKAIVVNVFGNGGLITGTWKVRLRENAERDKSGALIGAVLFEQEVIWTAMVTNVDMGGISLITWQPTGDAGSGKQLTSICNGAECAVTDDVTNEEEMEEYGSTGAWQYLDSPFVNPAATPREKYDIERGFSIFTSEGVASVGGSYQFYAVWQSANYNTDFAEGAVLETVYDRWQIGSLDTEALYRFSYKPGEDFFDGLTDRASGQTWWIYRKPGLLHIARARRHLSFDLGKDPVVMTGPMAFTRLAVYGHNLYVLYQSGVGVGLRYSFDEGFTWKGYADMVKNVTPLDSICDDAGGKLILLGKARADLEGASSGDLVRVLLTRTNEKREDGQVLGWKLQSITRLSFSYNKKPVVPPSKPKGRLTRVGSTLEWLIANADEVQIWRSTNEGEHWALASSPKKTSVTLS